MFEEFNSSIVLITVYAIESLTDVGFYAMSITIFHVALTQAKKGEKNLV